MRRLRGAAATSSETPLRGPLAVVAEHRQVARQHVGARSSRRCVAVGFSRYEATMTSNAGRASDMPRRQQGSRSRFKSCATFSMRCVRSRLGEQRRASAAASAAGRRTTAWCPRQSTITTRWRRLVCPTPARQSRQRSHPARRTSPSKRAETSSALWATACCDGDRRRAFRELSQQLLKSEPGEDRAQASRSGSWIVRSSERA